MAARFSLYPPHTIVPIVTRVLYPSYSRLQDDDDGMRRLMLRASGGIAFITMPLMIGLLILASPFVHVLLSAKWESSIALIAFLAPVGILQSVAAGSNGVMLAKNKTHWVLWTAGIKGVATIIALWCGIPWGIQGVALAYLIVAVPLSAVGFFVAGRLIHMPFWKPYWELRPYVIGTAVMAGAVLAVRFALVQAGAPMPIQLIAGTLVGAIAYIWMMLILRPPAVMDIVRVLPTRISRLLPRRFTADIHA
jgi:PST family polysaccharide transporter